MLKWNFPDTSTVTVNVNDTEMGYVKVNTLLLNQNIPGVSNTVYPWQGSYMNTVDVPLIAIAKPGFRFVQWLETGVTQDSITWTPNGNVNYTAIFEVDPTYQPIVINEVMLRNTNVYADNFNEFDDWTELFNPNPYDIDISACKITKGNYEWIIPNGTIIQANDYLIFWNDNQTYQGDNHLNFKLQNVDDIVYLKTASNQTIDSLHYTPTGKNESYGRYPNGSNTFMIFEQPTPNAFNQNFNSLGEIINGPSLQVYPNPSSGFITFNKTISFTLFDVLGKSIKTELNKNSIDVSNLDAGIYVLRSTDEETIKIIVK